jgi:Protein of unknown function (DUF2891)
MKIIPSLFVVAAALLVPLSSYAQMSSNNSINEKQASHFAALALKCVSREFPNKPEHVINNGSEVKSPKTLHPAFYGCYDWHSSVHGHWMLVRLLKTFTNLPEGPQIRNALNANLTAHNIRAEAEYMKQPNRQSFERTYGWAWALKLAEELHTWDDPDGDNWADNLQPLVDVIAQSYKSFLPKQTYPIRTGVHPNTAFGLAFALDYAKAFGDRDLEAVLSERSRTYFAKDINYPGAWEPGGEDFFSAALMEADLMRRVMKPAEFATWFHRFLPDVGRGQPQSLLVPATVSDRSDPKLVHLDGLNLSRAWCLRSVAAALPASDPARKILSSSAQKHAAAALPHVASGDYAGEHWLASFAVFMLSNETH